MNAQLTSVYDDIWNALEGAVGDVASAYRFPTLASVAADGQSAEVRTVVLRAAERMENRLICYSDSRAPKIAQFMSKPVAAWCFFDATAGLQIRVKGETHVEQEGDAVEARWAGLDQYGILSYAGGSAPGTPFGGEPNSDLLPRFQADPGSLRAFARQNFAVITTRVQSVDWLQLSMEGNRRAIFSVGGDGLVEGRWVQA